MATKTKPAAKPGEAKADSAKAATASPVATSELDKAAAQAALSNQGSGDTATTTAADGLPTMPGAGAAPAAAPGDSTTPGAPDGALSGAAGSAGPIDGQDGAPDGAGSIGTSELTDDQMAAAALLASTAASNESGEGDEHVTHAAPILSRTLVNQTAAQQRLSRLGVIIGAGESLLIGFRDEKHQEACEKQIDQLRLLGGWEEGCGLHWELDE